MTFIDPTADAGAIFTNDVDAAADASPRDATQATLEAVDFNAWVASHNATGLFEGLRFTAFANWQVAVEQGTWVIDGQKYETGPVLLDFTPPDSSGYARRDSIRADAGGLKVVIGVPASNPVCAPLGRDPKTNKVNEAHLGWVFIEPSMPDGITTAHLNRRGFQVVVGTEPEVTPAVQFRPFKTPTGDYVFAAGGGPAQTISVVDLNNDGNVDDVHDGTVYTLTLNPLLQPALSKFTPGDTFDKRVLLGPDAIGGCLGVHNPLTVPNNKDGHNYLSLALDAEGFLHVAGNCHNRGVRYLRSKYSMRDKNHPFAIDQWDLTNLHNIVSTNAATYSADPPPPCNPSGAGPTPHSFKTWELVPMSGYNERYASFPLLVLLPNDTLVCLTSQVGHLPSTTPATFNRGGTHFGVEGGDGDGGFSLKIWHPEVHDDGTNAGHWEELGGDTGQHGTVTLPPGTGSPVTFPIDTGIQLLCCTNEVDTSNPAREKPNPCVPGPGGQPQGNVGPATYSPFPLTYNVDAQSRIHVVMSFRTNDPVSSNCGFYYFRITGLKPGDGTGLRVERSDGSEILLPMGPPGEEGHGDPASNTTGGGNGLVKKITVGPTWTGYYNGGSDTTFYPESHWPERIANWASADLETSPNALTTRDTGIINESQVHVQQADRDDFFHGSFMAIDAGGALQHHHIYQDATGWHTQQITRFTANIPSASFTFSGTPAGSASRMKTPCMRDGRIYAFGAWPSDGMDGYTWCYDLTPPLGFVPPTCSIAADSNGDDPTLFQGAGELHVDFADPNAAQPPGAQPTDGFPGGGSVQVETSSGFPIEIVYSGKTGTSFTGCTAAYGVRNPFAGGAGIGTLASSSALGPKGVPRNRVSGMPVVPPPFKLHKIVDAGEVTYDHRSLQANKLQMVYVGQSRYYGNPALSGGDDASDDWPAGFDHTDLAPPAALCGHLVIDMNQVDKLKAGLAFLPEWELIDSRGGGNLLNLQATDWLAFEDYAESHLAGGPTGNQLNASGIGWHSDLLIAQDMRGSIIGVRLAAMFDVSETSHNPAAWIGVVMRTFRTEWTTPQNRVAISHYNDWSDKKSYMRGEKVHGPLDCAYTSLVDNNFNHPIADPVNSKPASNAYWQAPAIDDDGTFSRDLAPVSTRVGALINHGNDIFQDVAQTHIVCLPEFMNASGGAMGRIFVEAQVGGDGSAIGKIYAYRLALYRLKYVGG